MTIGRYEGDGVRTFTMGDGNIVTADYSAYQPKQEPWWRWLVSLVVVVLVFRWLWPKR
jgi:hypothetical protein